MFSEVAKKINVHVEFCFCYHGWNFTTNQAILIKGMYFSLSKFFDNFVLFM
jgi:hypothetical protein